MIKEKIPIHIEKLSKIYVSVVNESSIKESLNVLMNSFHYTSNKYINTKISEEIFYKSGKHRVTSDIGDFYDNIGKEKFPSNAYNDFEDRLYKVLIFNINLYLKKLEDDTDLDSNNKLKAICIKLIHKGVYFYDELYIPNVFKNLINKYIDNFELYRDYYKKVIEKLIESGFPDSIIIQELKNHKNSFMYLDVLSNDSRFRKNSKLVTEKETDILKFHRNDLNIKIYPNIKSLYMDFEIIESVYKKNLTSSMSDLSNEIGDPTVFNKLNRLILDM